MILANWKKVQKIKRGKLNEDMLRVQFLENKRSIHRFKIKNNNTDQEGQILIMDHKLKDQLWGKSAC